MGTFLKSLLILVGCVSLLFVAACKQDEDDGAEVKAWEVRKFNDAAAVHNAIGWSESGGGRSWTVEDENGYDEWIQEVPDNVLTLWDIPHDCADATMSLRFIYAYQKGLALKFGKYGSVDYADRPVEFLKIVAKKYGTVRLPQISYDLDMWDIKNYEGGNIFVQYEKGDESGHTIQLKNALTNKVYESIESTVPAELRELKAGYLFSRDYEVGRFMRFYAVNNDAGVLSYNKEISFEAHPPLNLEKPDWYACMSGGSNNLPLVKNEEEEVPTPVLWKLVFNTISYLNLQPSLDQSKLDKDGITCNQNVFWNPKYGGSKSNQPDYSQLFDKMFDQICHKLEQRQYAVQKGYDNCFGSTDSTKCNAGPSGDYSTPSRDKKLSDAISNYLRAADLSADEMAQKSCRVVFNDGMRSVKPFSEKGGYAYWIAGTLSHAHSNYYQNLFDGTFSDPRESIAVRWGCHEEDDALDCLDLTTDIEIANYILDRDPVDARYYDLDVGKTYTTLRSGYTNVLESGESCNFSKGTELKIIRSSEKHEFAITIIETMPEDKSLKNLCPLNAHLANSFYDISYTVSQGGLSYDPAVYQYDSNNNN